MTDRLLAGILAVALALTACGGADSADEWHARWGGPYDVYAEIFANRDCSALEALIIAEVAGLERQTARKEILDSTVLVQAAYRRMVGLSCSEAFQ